MQVSGRSSVDAASRQGPTVAVVGGGISGLVAAWHLSTQRPDLHIIVFEASNRVGGKLRQEDVGGHRIDVGAESALWRRPEVPELLTELGVEAVHPARFPAMLWSRGSLETLPAGTLMGIPSDPQLAAGLLDEAEVARAADERPVHLAAGEDISVGDAVEMALGSAVVDRMVEPLLGGVYAGHARELSAKSAVPALYRALESGQLLTSAAGVASSAVSSKDVRPVFGAPTGGMGGLPELLCKKLEESGVVIYPNAVVTSISRAPAFKGAWHLECERDGLCEPFEADGVILAVPAPEAAGLLPGVASGAGPALAAIEYASMAIVTFAFSAHLADALPASSGFLVPAIDGHTIKASTFSSVKWPWLAQTAPDRTYLRVSIGRHRESELLELPDEELVARGLQDLAVALNLELPEPLEAHVMRWREALPQYPVGHEERIAAIDAETTSLPAFELVGAYCHGVGIPACIATARAGADALLRDLESHPSPSTSTPTVKGSEQ